MKHVIFHRIERSPAFKHFLLLNKFPEHTAHLCASACVCVCVIDSSCLCARDSVLVSPCPVLDISRVVRKKKLNFVTENASSAN